MDARLRQVCFWIAAGAGALSLAGIPFASVRPALLPATVLVGAAAALLFLRMLFSRAYRHGIDAANREMRGDDPWPGRPKRFLDPEWGAFGRRTGPPALQWLRAALFFGIVPVMMLRNGLGTDVFPLWFGSLIVAMELSLMHIALSHPADRSDATGDRLAGSQPQRQ